MQMPRLTVFCLTGCVLLGASCSRRKPEPPVSPETTAPPAPVVAEKAPAPNDVLVRVGDAELTRGQADTIVRTRYLPGGLTNMPPARAAAVYDRAMRHVIEQFMARNLLLAEASRRNIVATDTEVEVAHDRAMQRMSSEDRRNLLSVREADAHFRGELAIGIRCEKLVKEALPPVGEPTEAALAAFVEENRERLTRPERVDFNHLLLSVQPSDTPAVKAARKAQAEAIREQLLADGDFAAMAATHSACPSRRTGGGFERPFSRHELAQLLNDEQAADTVFAMELNTIGPIVETPHGYHIVKLTGRHPGGTPQGDELIGIWKSHQQSQALRAFLTKLRETIPVTFPSRPKTSSVAPGETVPRAR